MPAALPVSLPALAPNEPTNQPSDPPSGHPSDHPFSPPPVELTAGGRNFLRMKEQYGIFEARELGSVLDKHPSGAKALVQGLIPRGSVNILVGDSGIGKSPLAYQLGLAVAAGKPFLDMPTAQGNVLLVDFENSLADVRWIMDRQRQHLRLEECPHAFQVWPMHLDPLRQKVEQVIDALAPDLVILDSLRSFNPIMESESSAAVGQIKQLRVTAARHGTAFLLIHHVRKHPTPGEARQARQARSPVSLEEGEVMDWLLRTAGARALINQMDVRLAVARRNLARDQPRERASGVEGTVGGKKEELILRGHYRTRGEVGPFVLRRKRSDGDGEPLGYELVTAATGPLENVEQRAFFERLPDQFSFKEARVLYGRSHEAANTLIQKMIILGMVRRTARGQYCKAGYARAAVVSP
jgi:hypothetical protein